MLAKNRWCYVTCVHKYVYVRLFNDLLLRSDLYYCVWSGIAGRISLQTTAIDGCHKHIYIYIAR